MPVAVMSIHFGSSANITFDWLNTCQRQTLLPSTINIRPNDTKIASPKRKKGGKHKDCTAVTKTWPHKIKVINTVSDCQHTSSAYPQYNTILETIRDTERDKNIPVRFWVVPVHSGSYQVVFPLPSGNPAPKTILLGLGYRHPIQICVQVSDPAMFGKICTFSM